MGGFRCRCRIYQIWRGAGTPCDCCCIVGVREGEGETEEHPHMKEGFNTVGYRRVPDFPANLGQEVPISSGTDNLLILRFYQSIDDLRRISAHSGIQICLLKQEKETGLESFEARETFWVLSA